METEDPRQLTQMLRPSMDLVSWGVRTIYELDRDQVMETIRQAQACGVDLNLVTR